MRPRYKKKLAPITKAIRILNDIMEENEKLKGRIFVKNIAFFASDRDRNNNNNFYLILRVYDKETGYYIERTAYIQPDKGHYVKNFAFYLHKQVVNFMTNYIDSLTYKDYRKVSIDSVIKRGHNVLADMKFTNRKD